MVVAQQRGHVFAAGLALGHITHHHQMRNRQRCRHRLGWAGMNLVVQRDALGVLAGVVVNVHGILGCTL
jgi:hypothetical protein